MRLAFHHWPLANKRYAAKPFLSKVNAGIQLSYGWHAHTVVLWWT